MTAAVIFGAEPVTIEQIGLIALHDVSVALPTNNKFEQRIAASVAFLDAQWRDHGETYGVIQAMAMRAQHPYPCIWGQN